MTHAGPFANIASGNNVLIADRLALKLGDIVVTEGGFGSTWASRSSADIVARAGGIRPAAVVLVLTPQTLQTHGPENLERHLKIVRSFGLDPVVAVNEHPDDSLDDAEAAREAVLDAGATVAEVCDGFERGGIGAAALAEAVLEATRRETSFRHSYDLDQPLEAKILAVAKLYGAADVVFEAPARAALEQLTADGLAGLPVCIAKTQYSLSHHVALGTTPTDFTFVVRELRPYTGAGWIVALAGDMMTMPGLSKTPAAKKIDIDADGATVGLFSARLASHGSGCHAGQ